MTIEFVNGRGHRTLKMSHAELVAATAWTRTMFHLIYGPDEGEVRFRSAHARQALVLWARTLGES